MSGSQVRFRSPAALAAIGVALAVLGAAPEAGATGMQGHMYVSEVALGHLPNGELKTLLKDRRALWLNGSFLPDSGYAANDAYGEMAHWEEFVEGYVQWIRANYDPPYTSGAVADHVAVLMGAASHSMVDQVFDELFMEKVEEMDAATDDLDTGIDAWLVVDLDRKENPDVVLDPSALSEVFATELDYEVSPDTILGGMNTAKLGLGAVISVLANGHQKYRDVNPWGAEHYLDAKVPGAYPHCARVIKSYWENLWRRLHGDTAFGEGVIGVVPEDGTKNVSVANESVDGRVTVFFGYGLDRDSISESSIRVEGPDGELVPTKVRLRGDTWVGTVQLTPVEPWAYRTSYTVKVTPEIATLYGTHPAQELVTTFTTACAPGDEASCAEATSSEAAGGGCGTSGRRSGAGAWWVMALGVLVTMIRRSGTIWTRSGLCAGRQRNRTEERK